MTFREYGILIINKVRHTTIHFAAFVKQESWCQLKTMILPAAAASVYKFTLVGKVAAGLRLTHLYVVTKRHWEPTKLTPRLLGLWIVATKINIIASFNYKESKYLSDTHCSDWCGAASGHFWRIHQNKTVLPWNFEFRGRNTWCLRHRNVKVWI